MLKFTLLKHDAKINVHIVLHYKIIQAYNYCCTRDNSHQHLMAKSGYQNINEKKKDDVLLFSCYLTHRIIHVVY